MQITSSTRSSSSRATGGQRQCAPSGQRETVNPKFTWVQLAQRAQMDDGELRPKLEERVQPPITNELGSVATDDRPDTLDHAVQHCGGQTKQDHAVQCL